MKKHLSILLVMTSLLGIFGCKKSPNPGNWSSKEVDEWFEKGDWNQGWNVRPSETIDRKAFAIYYHKNPDRWNKAFAFLRDHDLASLESKKYELDSTFLFISVSDYNSKNPADARFEVHRKYADIQYVANGLEQIGLAPLTAKDSVISPYNEEKDIELITIREVSMHKASIEEFFIFFPSDAHCPGIRVDESVPVHKVVVKVRVD